MMKKQKNKLQYALFPDFLIEESKKKKDDLYPFYIKISEEEFLNWVISIEELKIEGEGTNCSISFGFNVARVPKEINEQLLKEKFPKLKALLSEIVQDILETSIEDYEKINHNV